MSQVTLYFDDETEQLLRQSAQQAGLSNSKWVAQLIQQHTQQHWPSELLALAGAFADFPLRGEDDQLPDDLPRVMF